MIMVAGAINTAKIMVPGITAEALAAAGMADVTTEAVVAADVITGITTTAILKRDINKEILKNIKNLVLSKHQVFYLRLLKY